MADTLKSLAAFLPDDPVVYGLFIGAALLVIVVLLVQAPESSGKAKSGKKGTVTKKEGGKDVRRSTRSVHAPERWDPDTPSSPTGHALASPPPSMKKRAAAKTPASPGPASPRGRPAAKTPSKRGVSKSPSPPPARSTRRTPAKGK